MEARMKICLHNLRTLVKELGVEAGPGVYKNTLEAWDPAQKMKALEEVKINISIN